MIWRRAFRVVSHVFFTSIARIVRARVKKGQSKISEEWLSEHPEFMEDDKWISR